MKRTKRRNSHIGGDAMADVRKRVQRSSQLRARIDASVARAAWGDGEACTHGSWSDAGASRGPRRQDAARVARALGARLTVEFEGLRIKAA